MQYDDFKGEFINGIPVIDLEPMWHDLEGMKQVANEIAYAYKHIGFSYVINHQVPKDKIQQVFQAAQEFHALSLEEKMSIRQNDCFRGYVPMKASQLKVSTEGAAKKPNQLDAFVMAFEVSENHPDYADGSYLAGPNQWPQNLPDFKDKMLAYRDAMVILAHRLVQVFALALGLDRHGLDEYFINPTYFLRLQHYPEQPSNTEEPLYGIAPHTDYGFFSLLAQSDIEGLEVKHPEKGWVKVPYIHDSFVLNTGDMLKRWSNNIFRSTPHRVINRSGQDRYSVPFFFEPNMHSQIEVLPSCMEADEKPNYQPVKYGDYLLDRIQGNYGLGKKKHEVNK